MLVKCGKLGCHFLLVECGIIPVQQALNIIGFGGGKTVPFLHCVLAVGLCTAILTAELRLSFQSVRPNSLQTLLGTTHVVGQNRVNAIGSRK